MHISIQGRHLSVSPALNSHVKEKLKKIKYYFDHIIHVHVVLLRDNENFIADGTITAEYHHFHNRVSSDDMYKSINALMDKLERQIRRYKEHVIAKKRHSEARHVVLEHSHEFDESKRNYKVQIKDIQIISKPMSDMEAVLQFLLNPKARAMAFVDATKDTYPSFLILEDEKEKRFSIIRHDHYWERQAIFLHSDKASADNTLEYKSVESVKPSLESIEDALDYLSHNTSVLYRFFTSLRTRTEMLLYRTEPMKDSYYLLCKV